MFTLVPYQWRHLDNGVLGFMNNFSATRTGIYYAKMGGSSGCQTSGI